MIFLRPCSRGHTSAALGLDTSLNSLIGHRKQSLQELKDHWAILERTYFRCLQNVQDNCGLNLCLLGLGSGFALIPSVCPGPSDIEEESARISEVRFSIVRQNMAPMD
jgi:hypothetical protein